MDEEMCRKNFASACEAVMDCFNNCVIDGEPVHAFCSRPPEVDPSTEMCPYDEKYLTIHMRSFAVPYSVISPCLAVIVMYTFDLFRLT